jgi:hypothetical protein
MSRAGWAAGDVLVLVPCAAHPLIFFSTMSTMAFSYSHFIVFWSADENKRENNREQEAMCRRTCQASSICIASILFYKAVSEAVAGACTGPTRP